MDEAIEALYSVNAVHLIDHTVDADEGFNIGNSRPYAPKVAERLLKVRAMEKELGIDKKTKALPITDVEIKSQISSDSVEAVDAEVRSVIDRRNDLNQRITDLNATKRNLEILSELPIDLELYSGYATIDALVGMAGEDPTSALSGIECEIFQGVAKKGDRPVAVFVRKSDRDKAVEALSSVGFNEIALPTGTGSASAALAAVDRDISTAESGLEVVQKELEMLLEKHKSFLKAADEELSIQLEKGELPLRVASSEFTFVIDAWVPASKVEAVKSDLESMVDGIYVEVQETRGRKMAEQEEAEPRFKVPPSNLKNGQVVKEFEYVTKLVATPKYQEIDPSILIAIFFPLFFGLMVGDVGYAIPFIILGAYGLKVAKNKDWRAIATVLFFGGIWAFVFGFFFFGECLGMHFVESAHTLDVESTWQGLLGLDGLPEIFNGLLPHETGVGKLHDVGLLLKMSVYIGIVHLLIGYGCALYNLTIQHGFAHAFKEKGGWLLGFIGIVLLCFGLAMFLIYPDDYSFSDVLPFVGIGLVLIVVEIVMNIKHEGIQAILELPGFIGNILSYTRLAAIGMSKAGMALAFNYIAINMIAMGLGGVAGIIVGGLLFAFLHLMVWTLAILSAGLHGMRLQLVELMNKFYEGGGIEFKPLRIKRKQTIYTEKSTKEV
ncbi:MAG: V-type ATP synthase subunit I [Candidatus Methanomethylophilaceae archaeon]|nr:V-type ATP synthase subunit I [Thermoplasmata archaeon]MBQ3685193.1 V-type ATP synthase subunit I [Candidatus Methanomethylophilaceae archaeon]